MVRSFWYLKVDLLGKADKLVKKIMSILGKIGKPKTSESGGAVIYMIMIYIFFFLEF